MFLLQVAFHCKNQLFKHFVNHQVLWDSDSHNNQAQQKQNK